MDIKYESNKNKIYMAVQTKIKWPDCAKREKKNLNPELYLGF